ncbi:hypothetical protein BUALT_Bualt15G0107100 [Buddleja alternifolia]|uniref:Uncharacterized protein n=1 Tax=Buddleja alternifolia TaxID=168488 RepID=A0AAV6WQ49_9LAMI|nr:hypothetical protein BUALT_Bualt15G0107100 [Buddleja alternifolia]
MFITQRYGWAIRHVRRTWNKAAHKLADDARKLTENVMEKWVKYSTVPESIRAIINIGSKARFYKIGVFPTETMDKPKLEELKIQFQWYLYETQDFVLKIPPAQLYAASGAVLFTILFYLIIRLFKRGSSNTILLTGLSGSGKTVLFYQVCVKNSLEVRNFGFEMAPPIKVMSHQWLLPSTCIFKLTRWLSLSPSDKLRTSRTTLSSAGIANEYSLGVPGEAFAFSQCHNKVTVAEASGLTSDITQLEHFIRE